MGQAAVTWTNGHWHTVTWLAMQLEEKGLTRRGTQMPVPQEMSFAFLVRLPFSRRHFLEPNLVLQRFSRVWQIRVLFTALHSVAVVHLTTQCQCNFDDATWKYGKQETWKHHDGPSFACRGDSQAAEWDPSRHCLSPLPCGPWGSEMKKIL